MGTALHSGRTCSAEQLLMSMEKAHVDRSVVIPFPVIENCVTAHDLIGKAVRKNADRLVGCVYVYPLTDARNFRLEVRRCVEEYGFRAIKYQPQYQPLNLLSPASDYFFETALEFKLPVICHTGPGVPAALPSLFMMPAKKFPDLPIILAHSGGGGLLVGEAIVAATFCSNIYLELSTLMPNHIQQVLAHIPPCRLMLGSDLPENLHAELFKICQMDIPRNAKEDILWKTANQLF
jgi:predicted TIM-barrel fold metal-dependent hydrolase